MQAISSRQASPYRNIYALLSFLIGGLLTITSCADIKLQPKDPELLSLGNFANQVTIHLFEINPDTYEQYQGLLDQEIAPNILSKLRERGACAKSSQDAKQSAQAIQKNKQTSALHIESTTFPSRATAQGLIPVEIKGTCVKGVGETNKTAKFDILYLVGTNIKTKKPVIASIEIKKFN